MKQSTNHVVMVRPHKFTPNPETAADNHFQDMNAAQKMERDYISTKSYDEVTAVIEKLRAHNITVSVFEDDGQWQTPDSVFPNNWFSIHRGQKMALYPMYAKSRRLERRPDIIDAMKTRFEISSLKDYTSFENKNLFLEGTGAMVLDRVNHIAYVALSHRADRDVLTQFCADFDYTPISFTALDHSGLPIYHTNVMMGVGTGYALVCLESIHDAGERDALQKSLQETGHDIVDLSYDQMNYFAGNVLELDNGSEKYLVISKVGYEALTQSQIDQIEKHAKILTFDIPTIELAGGSIRCMLAEAFL